MRWMSGGHAPGRRTILAWGKKPTESIPWGLLADATWSGSGGSEGRLARRDAGQASRNQTKEEVLATDFTVEPSTLWTRIKRRFWVS